MGRSQGRVGGASPVECRPDGLDGPGRAGRGAALGHGPLAEPGILLRMVSPVAENEGPAARYRPAFADPRTAPALLQLAALVVAVVWFLLDAGASLGRLGPGGLRGPLLAWLAAAACGFGLGLVLRSRPARWLAAVDVVSIVWLLAAIAAGLGRHDALRVGLQSAVAALWVARSIGAATPSARAWAGIAVACLAAAAAALLRPLVLGAFGPASVQALSVGFLLLAVTAPQSSVHRCLPSRWQVVLVAGCLLLLGSVVPTAVLFDTATLPRLLFALAVGASLALAAGGPAATTFALVAVAALGSLWAQVRAQAVDAAAVTLLAASGTATADYDRATQTLRLSVDGEVVDRAGPDHIGSELAAVLVHLFAAPGDRVLVLGRGTGRLPGLLLRTGRHEVEVVDWRADGASLRASLGGDGPVPPAAAAATEDPRVRTAVRSWRDALATLPDASRQAIVIAEAPNRSTPLQTTVEAQRELRRVVGQGLVLQALPFDLVPVERLRALLAAASVAHAWNAVLAVGDDAWLLSAAAPPHWPADDAMSSWSDEARWIAHAAHVGSVLDVRRALHGTVNGTASAAARSEQDPPLASAGHGRREVLAVLHDLLGSEPIESMVDPRSLLLRWLGGRIRVQLAGDEIAGLTATEADAQRAQAIAVRFLPIGAPAAVLQAALGLPAEDGAPLVDAMLAIRRAFAIDPTFCAALPPVLAGLRLPVAARGDLEDLAVLPPRERLASLCVGGSPLAVALRARFASACARALVERIAARPLSAAEGEALRELADPFVLDEAARGLRARHAVAELLSLWRRDLPMPMALTGLLRDDDAEAALRFARALGGRTDADSMLALAECLTAPAIGLRREAAQALRASVGDRIDYDPEWPRSALNEAADRLRSLHNRTP